MFGYNYGFQQSMDQMHDARMRRMRQGDDAPRKSKVPYEPHWPPGDVEAEIAYYLANPDKYPNYDPQTTRDYRAAQAAQAAEQEAEWKRDAARRGRPLWKKMLRVESARTMLDAMF